MASLSSRCFPFRTCLRTTSRPRGPLRVTTLSLPACLRPPLCGGHSGRSVRHLGHTNRMSRADETPEVSAPAGILESEVLEVPPQLGQAERRLLAGFRYLKHSALTWCRREAQSPRTPEDSSEPSSHSSDALCERAPRSTR